jgi:twinfilin-like protein
MAKEIVNLEMAEMTDVHSLGRQVPNDHGRYHLFRFPHSHEGDWLESTS